MRERQTHELTNLQKYSVMAFFAVTFWMRFRRACSLRDRNAIFSSRSTFQSDIQGRTLTFSANTNTDFGEQESISWGSGGCGCATLCDRIGEKTILPEYAKNKVVRQLPVFSLACWNVSEKVCNVRSPSSVFHNRRVLYIPAHRRKYAASVKPSELTVSQSSPHCVAPAVQTARLQSPPSHCQSHTRARTVGISSTLLGGEDVTV